MQIFRAFFAIFVHFKPFCIHFRHPLDQKPLFSQIANKCPLRRYMHPVRARKMPVSEKLQIAELHICVA